VASDYSSELFGQRPEKCHGILWRPAVISLNPEALD